MTRPDLSIALGALRMRNPVTVASGTFGYGPEYADLVDLNKLGAIVVKGISPEPVKGNPSPRTVEVASGLINAIGLQNPGARGFIDTYLPFLRRYDVPVLVNIWGRTTEDYERVAEVLGAEDGVAALEVNVSCPNIKEGSCLFGTNPEMFKRVVSGVRSKATKPMIVKLAPDLYRVREFAKFAEECGADAVSLINSIPAMAIDVETRRAKLGNITGGLSGPAIHPIAVKMVWEVSKAVKIPLIAMGGIARAEDAIEFLLAGATAVAVGTANFTHPSTVIEVVDGIEAYLVRHGLGSVRELVGGFRP